MPRNSYFSQGSKSEQNLYADVIIEALKIYGHDVYYLPRKILNLDGVFNEATVSEFASSYVIEAYIENLDSFEGEGDLYTKFGYELRDQATLVISNRRWQQMIGRFLEDTSKVRPSEGDIIYFPMVNTLFEITFVEEESPFYQLQNLPVFKLKIEAFEYGNESIDTSVEAIDAFESEFGSRTRINVTTDDVFDIGETIVQTQGTITVSAEIAEFIENTNSPEEQTFDLVGISTSDNSNTNFIAGAFGNEASPQSVGVIIEVSTLDTMDDIDTQSQTEEFEIAGKEFIDFSETSPFGMP
jgi:hypothetical protein